jgi:protoheme ferro-lyase
MLLAAWAALLLGATLTGTALVGSMALPSRRDALSAVGALVALVLTLFGLVAVTLVSMRVDEAIVAAFLALAAFLGGFALGAALLSQLGAEPEPVPLPSACSPARLGPAVVLLADAEPEHYDPASVSREIRELADVGVQLPPEPTRVFVYMSEKSRYRMEGASIARPTVRLLADRLARRLEDEGFSGVTVAWCGDAPRLDEVVNSLAERGVCELVVTVLATGESHRFMEAKRRVDAMRTAASGVRIAYAQPLWSSNALAELVTDHIVEALGEERLAESGVALVGHGQPAELEEADSTVTEQEMFFHQRVRALLVERGLEAQRVRLGWLEWQEPGVTEVVRHLAALGCTRIAVVPSAMPFDTISTVLDIPDGIVQARVEGAAEVTVLPAWGDDPVVAEVLAQLVREAAAELS